MNFSLTSSEIVPAPAPPVCHAEAKVPGNWVPVTEREAHAPTAERGSEGIKEFSSPSW